MFIIKILLFALSIAGICLLALKKPHLLIYLLVISVALEISRTWYPGLELFQSEEGTLSLTRLVTVGLIAAGALRIWQSRETRGRLHSIFGLSISRAALFLVALGAVSILYSIAEEKSLVETLRLLVLFALFISVSILGRRLDIIRVFHTLHWTGVVLALIAGYEFITGRFLWFQYWAEVYPMRVNATFVDANIFARFLILAVIANLILQSQVEGFRQKFLYLSSLPLLLWALLTTNSRGGLITLTLVMVFALVLMPRKKIVVPLYLITASIALFLLINPSVLYRFIELKTTIPTSDARAYLSIAALTLFQTQPLMGVGLGGFQEAFVANYPDWPALTGGVTLSHSTLLKIAAEQGTIGLAALLLVWLTVLRLLLGIIKSRAYGILAIGSCLLLLAVFISSQFEGRFFEDPITWLSMSMLVVLKMENTASSSLGRYFLKTSLQ